MRLGLGAEMHQTFAVTPVSFSAPAQVVTSHELTQPSSSSTASDQSFAAYLKKSAHPEDEHPEPSQAAPIHKQIKDKAQPQEHQSKSGDTQALLSSDTPAQPPVQDPRTLLLSWPKSDSAGSGKPDGGNADKARAVTDPKSAQSTASVQTSQKSPLVFGVNLQKGDKQQQQHSDTCGSDAQAPSATVKNAAPAPLTANAQPITALHSGSPAPVMVPNAQQVQSAYSHVRVTPAAAPAAPAQIMNSTELPQSPVTRSQTIDLKVAGADNNQIDVRVSQRAGDVQVTVRTADGDLAQSLRQHLPELSDRLSQTGVHGDIWQPTAASSTNTGTNNSDTWSSDHSQQQQQPRRDTNHGANSEQQQHRESAWMDELNNAETQG